MSPGRRSTIWYGTGRPPLPTIEVVETLRFFVRESLREYTFERDDAGRIVRLRITEGGPELVAQRVE